MSPHSPAERKELSKQTTIQDEHRLSIGVLDKSNVNVAMN